jgi:hypothetical protein
LGQFYLILRCLDILITIIDLDPMHNPGAHRLQIVADQDDLGVAVGYISIFTGRLDIPAADVEALTIEIEPHL